MSGLKVATWNVNSVRARLEPTIAWLRSAQPDVVLLQETKVVDEQFPKLPFLELGYALELHGQPGLNGVAILSKHPLAAVRRGLPGDPDDAQARWIEADVAGLRVASVYVPNGTALASPNFPYKLAFLGRMRRRICEILAEDRDVVIGGDINVAPSPLDVFDPAACEGDICFHPDERRALRGVTHMGVYDAFRARAPDRAGFSWWHYQGASWERDAGLRIDLILASGRVLDRIGTCEVDRSTREGKGVSDHAPVWCEIAT